MKLTPEEDREFVAVILKDIPFFHQMYAKYGDLMYLGIIKELSNYSAKLKP